MSWTKKAGDGTEPKSELDLGTGVEMEHADTIRWIFDNITGPEAKIPDGFVEEVATKIAQEHLKEMPDYYTRLKEMENK